MALTQTDIDRITQALEPRFEQTDRQFGEVCLQLGGVRQDITEVRQDITEMRQDITEVRQDITEMRQDITEVRLDIDNLAQAAAQQFLVIDGRFDHMGEQLADIRAVGGDYNYRITRLERKTA